MAEKSLVIVESPTKARTISQFLGKDFVVKASNGHVRDLPTSAAEVPAKYKKEPWARLGVNVDKNFEALYVVPASKKQSVKELKEALKKSSVLYLATDEDREGESISWHLLEILKPKVPVKRLVFHEITNEAIAEALSIPRDIDESLVKAQETRRIVDRLYGYEVSPLLWKKIVTGLSAGRVQSVAIRLLTDREYERLRFHKAIYWGLKGEFSKTDGASTAGSFEAALTHLNNKRVAVSKDFDPNTGRLGDGSDVVVLDDKAAQQLKEDIQKETPIVSSVEEKPYTTRPSPPFVTSTLQQEGNRKLRLSAKRTMIIAQQLYENGFITYMRTDSTTLSEQAIRAARQLVKESYGTDYLPAEPRVYKTKVKNVQEAHEAIRPAGERFTSPAEVKSKLGSSAAKLYELIWKRTVACQMADAHGTHINVGISCGNALFRAVGKTITFPGFLRAYVEGSDDPEAELADQEKILPKLVEAETLRMEQIQASSHTTQPPPRYTEGSLIKELERRGIGRPSTWATVVETVLSRAYAFKKGNALVPTFTAMAVVNLLRNHFTQLLDYDFTARLEDDLDAISLGQAQSIEYLQSFYFGNSHSGLKAMVDRGEKTIDPREVCAVPIGTTEDDVQVEVRIGRYGPFISNGTHRAAVPDRTPPDELSIELALELISHAEKGPESFGPHPETGEPVYVKSGRYGPYVQLGDGGENGEKPKMISLLAGMKPEEVDFQLALKLLTLPRTLGTHPESKEDIIAAIGRYGPYIKCGSETRSIPQDFSTPIDIDLAQAIELLKQPKKGRRRSQPKILRELGAHPVSERNLAIKNGPYGPYVTDGEINASLPKDMAPDSVTMDDAVELLERKASSAGKGKTKSKKKSAAKSKAKTKGKTTAKAKAEAKDTSKTKTKTKAKGKTTARTRA